MKFEIDVFLDTSESCPGVSRSETFLGFSSNFVTYRTKFWRIFSAAFVHTKAHKSVVWLEPRDWIPNQIDKRGLVHRVPKKIIVHTHTPFI